MFYAFNYQPLGNSTSVLDMQGGSDMRDHLAPGRAHIFRNDANYHQFSNAPLFRAEILVNSHPW